eukprot:gene15943-18953_t
MKRSSFVGIVVIVFFFTSALADWESDIYGGKECRFAQVFSRNDLETSEPARREFMKHVLHYEGNFHKHKVGIEEETGMTIDGCSLDYFTGNLTSTRRYTAPSKESLHLMIMAIALNGTTPHGDDALDFFHLPIPRTDQENIDLPTFLRLYPCLGGWQPWGGSSIEKGINVDDDDESVPGLDNGQMAWGLYAVQYVLETKYPQHAVLAQRAKAYLDRLGQTVAPVFYDKNGGISMKTVLRGPVTQPWGTCKWESQADDEWYLDDMYEGELMAVYTDLFSTLPQEEKDKIWALKMRFYYKDVYKTPMGDITYAEGWTFSSHEQWKYLQIPYQEIPLHRRLLANAEKLKTWWANINNYPGLFAACYNTTTPDLKLGGYYVPFGVKPAARGTIRRNDTYTPYGACAVPLVDHTAGLVWYHNMLQGPAMQGPYGSTEAGAMDGTQIAAKLSWDTKGTTVVGLLGGTGLIVKDALIRDGKWARFQQVLGDTYATKFTEIIGDEVPMAYPSVTVPHPGVVKDFTLCEIKPTPTPSPTPSPTEPPTPSPTEPPTPPPTEPPTPSPTDPTPSPTEPPTPSPTPSPTEPPTPSPTPSPTEPPTPSPTEPPNTVTNRASDTVTNTITNRAPYTFTNTCAITNTITNRAPYSITNRAPYSITNTFAYTISNALSSVTNAITNTFPNNSYSNTIANTSTYTFSNNTISNAISNALPNSTPNSLTYTISNAISNALPNSSPNSLTNTTFCINTLTFTYCIPSSTVLLY